MEVLSQEFYNEFVGGLKLDFSSKVWGGKGWHCDSKGKVVREKDRTIRIGKPKAVKAVREIKPAIAVLASEHDNGGRTVAEHRAMVDWYGERYDEGLDPITGEPITDTDEMKGCNKPRNDEPWRDNRYSAYTDADGLKLLADAFRAIHATLPEDDDD